MLIGLSLFGFFLPVFTQASPLINDPISPYEILDIDARIEEEQIYLGELVGEPHSFEFSLGEEKTFVATLMQLDEEAETIPLSLILVRVNDNNRGVKEVGRVKGADMSWVKITDSGLGIKFKSSEPISYKISTGTYRVEISTPNNLGKYLIRIGETPREVGYFARLDDIRLVQRFFGFSFFHLFLSAYFYYPLGIMVILVLFWFTWRYHQKIRHD